MFMQGLQYAISYCIINIGLCTSSTLITSLLQWINLLVKNYTTGDNIINYIVTAMDKALAYSIILL